MSELRVDNIVSQDGSAAPVYSQGVIVGSGKTFTVRGDVDFQSGANVSGAVTFSSLSIASGFDVSGVVTATSFTGSLTGNASGTAGSLAAGATGADLTLSGNLTVNGTTTTIDTAVTAVDSLSVDGAIAFAGGKANGLSNADGVDLRLRSDTTNDQVFAIYKNGAGDAQRTAFINSDGSATFAGDVNVGAFDASSATATGVKSNGIYGQFVIQKPASSAGNAFEIWGGTSRTVSIDETGSANFVGTIESQQSAAAVDLFKGGYGSATGTFVVRGNGTIVGNESGNANTGNFKYKIDSNGTITDKLNVDIRRLKITNTTGAQTVNTTNYSSGEAIVTDGGGSVTFEGGASGLAAGSMITVVNKHSSNCTLTQGTGVTLRFTDGTTGNKTLAGYGVATILYITNAIAVITGSGVS